MNKTPLVAFALFLPLALGAWKWSRSLEERLERPHSLHFEVVKGNMISSVKFTPPLTDAFTVYVGDLSQYKSGYQHEEWKVEHLQFRASPTHNWKTLPESLWRTDWQFLDPKAYGSPDDVKRQTTYSVFSYSRKRELLVGQYQMRAQLSEEFHDNTSGVKYLGAQRLDFTFHVNAAPKGKKRVVLDNVTAVEK